MRDLDPIRKITIEPRKDEISKVENRPSAYELFVSHFLGYFLAAKLKELINKTPKLKDNMMETTLIKKVPIEMRDNDVKRVVKHLIAFCIQILNGFGSSRGHADSRGRGETGEISSFNREANTFKAVSYTHLTLPTILLV